MRDVLVAVLAGVAVYFATSYFERRRKETSINPRDYVLVPPLAGIAVGEMTGKQPELDELELDGACCGQCAAGHTCAGAGGLTATMGGKGQGSFDVIVDPVHAPPIGEPVNRKPAVKPVAAPTIDRSAAKARADRAELVASVRMKRPGSPLLSRTGAIVSTLTRHL